VLGSAIISAAKDGVDRFGNQSLCTLGSGAGGGGSMGASGTLSPSASFSGLSQAAEGSAAANLNENLKNIGKFFRRDLGGLGGRFGRGGEDSGSK
jgi:hypothetical protein